MDDYAGYKALFAQGVTEVGCWAHIRRLFFELHAAKASAHAEPALRHIAELYRIEAQVNGLDPPERLAQRQREARPVLDAFQRWIDDVSAPAAAVSGVMVA
ncbi:MAG: hypothetical protein AMXMBFR59_41390 [Rhodanobacteraceae bacterium]